MNLMKMTLKNLLREKKKYLLFTVVEALCIAVILNTINISTIGIIEKSVTVTQTEMQLFVIVVFSFGVSCYMENYFLLQKSKDIAIIRLSGASLLNLSVFLGTQNSLIEILGAVVGLIFGALISVFVSPAGITLEALGLVIIIAFLKFLVALMCALGFSYRTTIAKLITLERTVYDSDNRRISIPSKVYWISYVVSLMLLFLITFIEAMNMISTVLIAITVIVYGIIKFWLPEKIDTMRKEGLIYKRDKMICMDNTIFTVNRTAILAFVMIVGTMIIESSILVPSDINYEERFVRIVQLVTFMILVGFSLLFKLFNEMEKRKTAYKNLSILGYSKDEVMKLIYTEVVYYFGMLIIYIMIPLTVIILAIAISRVEALAWALSLTALPILFTFLIGTITAVGYKNIVNKVL